MEEALELDWDHNLPPLLYRIWLCVSKRVAIKVLMNNPDHKVCRPGINKRYLTAWQLCVCVCVGGGVWLGVCLSFCLSFCLFVLIQMKRACQLNLLRKFSFPSECLSSLLAFKL